MRHARCGSRRARASVAQVAVRDQRPAHHRLLDERASKDCRERGQPGLGSR
jgi:hypothetical protein